MNWRALADAVIRRRVELGYQTRKDFIAASGFGARTVGDIETARRDSYDPATLARLETALRWPAGRAQAILSTAAPEPSWLSTPEGIARHLFRDDLPLIVLLHRSGLDETTLFQLILTVRARREEQQADLLAELADLIRAAGGWAPDPVLPVTWLAGGESQA